MRRLGWRGRWRIRRLRGKEAFSDGLLVGFDTLLDLKVVLRLFDAEGFIEPVIVER